MAISTGPSIRAVCRIINQNSCGSGSICGYDDDMSGSYVLTNSHVVGTQINRQVTVEVESLNRKRFTGRVVRAAYSSSVSADWALLHVPGLLEVEPVYLTRELPKKGESMYTRGFPRCQAHQGTDITQYAVLNNGVLLWEPDAIGGQSGSGVWGDDDHLQKALLTWSMQYRGKWRGAGQLTNEIWSQNRDFKLNRSLRGAPHKYNFKELPGNDYDFTDIDRSGLTDPEVKEGIFSEPIKQGIQDYPIWFEEVQPEEPEPDPEQPSGPGRVNRNRVIASLTRIQNQTDIELKRYQDEETEIVDPADPETGLTFGL